MCTTKETERERAVNRAWSARISNRALLLGFVSLLTDGCRVPSDWAGSAATLAPLLSPPLRRRVRHLLPLFADMALSHRSRRGRPAVPSRRSSGVRATNPAPTAAALAQVSSSPPPSFIYVCFGALSLQPQTLAPSVISLAPPFVCLPIPNHTMQIVSLGSLLYCI